MGGHLGEREAMRHRFHCRGEAHATFLELKKTAPVADEGGCGTAQAVARAEEKLLNIHEDWFVDVTGRFPTR